MMSAMTAVNMFMFFILPLGCMGARMEIDPPHIRVSEDPTNITVTCRFSAPITGCQFSWWSRDYHTNRAGPVLDLNMGAESVADPAHLEDKHRYPWRPLLGYTYSGRSFSRGDCGVRMEVHGKQNWLISCRVKIGNTWVYDWMDLDTNTMAPIPHNLEPRREVVVVQGGQVRILLKTQGGLDRCYFSLPVENFLVFDKGPSSSESTGRHLYQGAGLSAGECGLALGNITERDNGLVRSMMGKSSPLCHEYRLTPLIVASPPTPPVLSVSGTGNNITATCRVESSRPAPNITWSLGDQVIPQDGSLGTEDENWRWPWTAGSWSQTITVTIQPQDSGKELKCSLTHVTLTRPLEVAEVVQSTGTLSPHVTDSSTSTTTPTPKSIPSTKPIHRTTTPIPNSTTSTLSTFPTVPGSQEEPSGLVGGACQELWAGWTQLHDTCCLKGGAATRLAEEIGRLTLEAAKSRARREAANAETATVQLEAAKSKSQQELEAAKAKAEAAKTIAQQEVEAAKSKTQQEVEAGMSKTQQEVEAAKAKAEAAKIIAQQEMEVAKFRARREAANAETATVQLEAAKVQLEAAKSKAQQEVEASRTWTKVADEELEFMRESHRRQLDNCQPQIDVRIDN